MKKKLPASLTTVTTFSKILAILLFLLFLLGTFREGMKYQHAIDMMPASPTISTVPTVTPTTAPSTGNVHTINMQDNGEQVDTKVGDRVLLQLQSGLDWNVQLSNNDVLQPSPDGVIYIKATQGRYRAVAPGSVVISANGRAYCPKGSMCPQFIVAFTTTVHVDQ